MNKLIVTTATVQRGYQDAPAIKYFGEENSCAEFTASEPYFDPKAEKHTSWNNWSVKAFRSMCDKIKKMGLKEGSRITFCGSVRTEKWRSKDGDSRQRFYVMLEDIEYASAGTKKAADPDPEPVKVLEKETEPDSGAGDFTLFDDEDFPFHV